MLRAGLEARLRRHFIVVGEGLHRRLQFGGEHQVGIAVAGGPGHRVAAHHAGNPDRRVRVLVGPRPRIHVAVVVVLAFPAERAGLRPRLDDEVVRFLEALPVVRRHGVVGDALAPGAAHPAGYQTATRDHVDFREFLGQEQRVVPDRQDVAEQHDLGAAGDAGEDRGFQIHHPAHAEGRRVVFVQHQAVEAHLLGEHALVQIAVVEIGAELRVVAGVGHAEVHDAAPGGAEVARAGVLVGAFGEVADEHCASPRSLALAGLARCFRSMAARASATSAAGSRPPCRPSAAAPRAPAHARSRA